MYDFISYKANDMGRFDILASLVRTDDINMLLMKINKF